VVNRRRLGRTIAIGKLVGILWLRIPLSLDDNFHLGESSRRATPVVFTGLFEHHWCGLPWRESIPDVTVIDRNAPVRRPPRLPARGTWTIEL
jgi:hypothetical protein